MNHKNTFTLIIFLIFSTALLAQELTPKEKLGKQIFFDNISNPDWMSCATCHAPQVGYVGPIPGINKGGAVYRGAVTQRFGNRKPPSSAYATFSPVLTYDSVDELFIGGNFWDGRATGQVLGNPAADQAMGPFLNPVEQNNASKKDVLIQIKKAKYSYLWEQAWGEPLDYSTPELINLNYGRVALAIAEYEASDEVNPFTSKFDYYLKGEVDLTPQELQGMNLFNGIAMCSLCHISEPGTGGEPPLFTDFTFDNLGAPKNPENPFYQMDQVFLPDGSPINPMGDAWIDYGLGGFLASLDDSHPWKQYAADNMGKHKVPTLRNVDKRPGNNFTKAYLHNGVLKSLKDVVHFYNTRDVAGSGWPPPEVAVNVNDTELGDLGLTEDQEDAIVAFMATLSDGFRIDNVKSAAETRGFDFKVDGPNPFNPSTRLSYYLTADSDIQLDIYNINGERLLTLQKGFMSAGEHRVEFNANRLASGLYLASLNTGSEIKTIKLMLVK